MFCVDSVAGKQKIYKIVAFGRLFYIFPHLQDVNQAFPLQPDVVFRSDSQPQAWLSDVAVVYIAVAGQVVACYI